MRIFLSFVLLLALSLPGRVFAQAATTMVVGTCGTASYTSGKLAYPTQDTTGQACTDASGGGGGSTAATASAAALPVGAGTDKPLNIDLLSQLRVLVGDTSGNPVDWTAPVGIMGVNGSSIATASNGFPTTARTITFSTACSQLTLPGSGAGAYAVNDLVANSATAGSVTPISCAVGSFSGASIRITRASLLTSTTSLTNASFSVEFYTSSPTVTNGNDGAFLSISSGHFCSIPITLALAFSNGADGQGTPSVGSDCARVLSGTATVYALIRTVGAYTWTNSMTFDLTVEGVE